MIVKLYINNFSITVVIPHHRDYESLVLAVQSAAAQTFQPLEIVVVNDDDRPLSASVSNRLLASNANVNIIELGRCTGSPAYPRNLAISRARTTYLAFLDADDLWLPNHLERLVQLWRCAPNAIIHGHQLCWGKYLQRPFFQEGLPTYKNSKSTFRQLLRFGNKIYLSSVGAPCWLLQRYQFDLELIWEDFDLWLRLAADGHPFINSNSCNTLYQIRSGSRSGRLQARRKGAAELRDKYFVDRPIVLLPPWLLRNLYF